MANIFVISDTHFSHANIIEFCGRPFQSVAEMDATMIERWNHIVRPSDHVYHLGDVAMKKPALALVKQLHGHKRLVMGNHDIFDTKEYLAAGFQKLCGMRVLDGILFTHVPIHPHCMGRFRGNVHGHIHQMKGFGWPYLNVSVEAVDYIPVSLEDLSCRLRNRSGEPPARFLAVDPVGGIVAPGATRD